METALYYGKEVEVIARGQMFSKVQNIGDPSSARTASTASLKPVLIKKVRQGFMARRPLTISDFAFDQLCEIWGRDPNFSMPISVSPDQENDVLDEVPDAEDGLTEASHRKLAPSYDIVFSTDPAVDGLLAGTGGHAGPYYDSPVLRVFHGPRKAMYDKLLVKGFKPTRMAQFA